MPFFSPFCWGSKRNPLPYLNRPNLGIEIGRTLENSEFRVSSCNAAACRSSCRILQAQLISLYRTKRENVYARLERVRFGPVGRIQTPRDVFRLNGPRHRGSPRCDISRSEE